MRSQFLVTLRRKKPVFLYDLGAWRGQIFFQEFEFFLTRDCKALHLERAAGVRQETGIFGQKHRRDGSRWDQDWGGGGEGGGLQTVENCSSRGSWKEGLEKERPRTIKEQGQGFVPGGGRFPEPSNVLLHGGWD